MKNKNTPKRKPKAEAFLDSFGRRTRGPVRRDKKPGWPHASGGPWAQGKDREGRTVWV